MKDITVLGLLGPAGSGKDLVADWLVEKNFVKIAFADPIKRFVAEAFGIDDSRLWGPSENRNTLFDVNETWWYEAIGHFGKAAEEIVNHVLLEGSRISGYLKLHTWMTDLRNAYRDKISTRLILQTLGTEWGRAVDPLMWARYAYQSIYQLRLGGHTYSQRAGLVQASVSNDTSYDGFVITDHRFINEIKYTRNQGGYVIRLRRLAKEKVQAVGITGHQSEAEQKDLSDDLFDTVFNFPEGVEKVHELLEMAFEEKSWIKGTPQRIHYL